MAAKRLISLPVIGRSANFRTGFLRPLMPLEPRGKATNMTPLTVPTTDLVHLRAGLPPRIIARQPLSPDFSTKLQKLVEKDIREDLFAMASDKVTLQHGCCPLSLPPQVPVLNLKGLNANPLCVGYSHGNTTPSLEAHQSTPSPEA